MNTGRRGLLGLALLGGLNRVMAAGPGAPALAGKELDAELAAVVADPSCTLASLSVLAIRRGRVAYQQQFGQRFIATAGLPARPANARTLFRIASISKMMSTFGAMRLVEEGKLALDTDVSIWLGFALRNPHFPDQAITLRQLLSHTSSLRDDAGYAWPASTSLHSVLVPGQANHGSGAMWASNAGTGAYFTYANLGWGVIGTIMEAASGERFDRLMQRLLLDPLGMHGGFNPAEFSGEDLANLATLYRKRTTDTEVWDPSFPWIAQVDDYRKRRPAAPAGIATYVIGSNATPFSPTGGLRASAADMGKIMLMLINDGVHEGKRILQSATLKTMFTRQWSLDANGSNGDSERGLFRQWGLGNQHFVDGVAEGGHFSGVGHLGEAYGLMSVFVVDLAARSGIVLLVGGVAADPEQHRGQYSSLARFEERILSALYRRVIAT
jgi:CubicO group peptidase (beta-lactamase class C family)